MGGGSRTGRMCSRGTRWSRARSSESTLGGGRASSLRGYRVRSRRSDRRNRLPTPEPLPAARTRDASTAQDDTRGRRFCQRWSDKALREVVTLGGVAPTLALPQAASWYRHSRGVTGHRQTGPVAADDPRELRGMDLGTCSRPCCSTPVGPSPPLSSSKPCDPLDERWRVGRARRCPTPCAGRCAEGGWFAPVGPNREPGGSLARRSGGSGGGWTSSSSAMRLRACLVVSGACGS